MKAKKNSALKQTGIHYKCIWLSQWLFARECFSTQFTRNYAKVATKSELNRNAVKVPFNTDQNIAQKMSVSIPF